MQKVLQLRMKNTNKIKDIVASKQSLQSINNFIVFYSTYFPIVEEIFGIVEWSIRSFICFF